MLLFLLPISTPLFKPLRLFSPLDLFLVIIEVMYMCADEKQLKMRVKMAICIVEIGSPLFRIIFRKKLKINMPSYDFFPFITCKKSKGLVFWDGGSGLKNNHC